MLGKKLRDLRIAKNLTQQELSNILKIPRGTYAHYEIGKREPDIATLLLFAKFFKVSVDYLLDNDTPHTIQSKEAKMPKDLIQFLEQSEVLFDGILLSEVDKAKIKASLEIIFWDEKHKNKHKKS